MNNPSANPESGLAQAFNADEFADFQRGLKTLSAAAFPKACTCCGRIYETAEQYIRETQTVRQGMSGLKESMDFDDAVIIESYRNCACGSTLMECFQNRRDTSPSGLKRREKFQELLAKLTAHGLDPAVARTELLKVVRGEQSEVINRFVKKK